MAWRMSSLQPPSCRSPRWRLRGSRAGRQTEAGLSRSNAMRCGLTDRCLRLRGRDLELSIQGRPAIRIKAGTAVLAAAGPCVLTNSAAARRTSGLGLVSLPMDGRRCFATERTEAGRMRCRDRLALHGGGSGSSSRGVRSGELAARREAPPARETRSSFEADFLPCHRAGKGRTAGTGFGGSRAKVTDGRRECVIRTSKPRGQRSEPSGTTAAGSRGPSGGSGPAARARRGGRAAQHPWPRR